jgi:dephospho-CoA kinase
MTARPTRILLGGGIGSGKSTAAAWFREHGATVVDTDGLARQLLQPGTPQTAAVIARWPEVGSPPGTIDRGALGRIVFGDPGEIAALEEIVHPGVRLAVAEASTLAGDALLIVEIPILRDLVGDGWPWIVVDAPVDVRVERAVRRGPMTEAEVLQVLDRQDSRGAWLAAASWVIDNSGDDQHLAEECARVWEHIRPEA